MSSPLSKDLRQKYNVRSMPIRKDDEVQVIYVLNSLPFIRSHVRQVHVRDRSGESMAFPLNSCLSPPASLVANTANLELRRQACRFRMIQFLIRDAKQVLSLRT